MQCRVLLRGGGAARNAPLHGSYRKLPLNAPIPSSASGHNIPSGSKAAGLRGDTYVAISGCAYDL